MILLLVFVACCVLFGLVSPRFGARQSLAVLALAALLATVYLVTGLI